MASEDVKKLAKEFPELSQSTLGDFLSNFNNNRDQAAKALRGLGEETKQQNEKKN